MRKICHNNKYSGVFHRDFERNQNQVSMRNEPLEKIKIKSETANLQKSKLNIMSFIGFYLPKK